MGLITKVGGGPGNSTNPQSPTDLLDTFDCARGKLMAGMVAPL